MIMLSAIFILFAGLIPAIETHEVNLGHGGVYDGAVRIGRDDAGRLIFFDQDLATTVTLGDLFHRSVDHDALLGLGDDDHPQYLLHSELDSLAKLELAIGGADLIDGVEGNARYLRLDGANSPVHVDGTNNRVGVGTATPPEKLSVGGSMEIGMGATGYIRNYNSTRTQNGWLKLYDISNGNVELGTTWSAGDIILTPGSSGGVGIQASAPGEALQIGSTAGTAKSNYIYMGTEGGDVGYFSTGLKMRMHSENYGFDVLNVNSATATVAGLNIVRHNNSAAGESALFIQLATGDVTVARNLNLAGQGGRLTIAGRPVVMGPNLLDNPDFNIWQRNLSQTCAAGGDAGGTMNYPQPGTLVTGSDRWQMSRAGTTMSTVVSRETPPAGLPTAAWCLKQAVAGGDPCRQYLFQAVPREVTRSLRGGWVSFAISHYMAGGSDGGTIAIYKTVSGTVTELASYAFASTPDSWERLAIAAQVPTDAETLLVGIQSNLSLSGTTVSYVANAVLATGRYVPAPEKVSDPALSSLPPMAKFPAGDLAGCQAYFEKGSIRLTGYSPDSSINVHGTMVHFNTAKAGAPTLSFTNFTAPQLASPNIIASEMPTYVEGRDYPQGFRFEVSGVTALATMIGVSADWQAECGEPL